MNTILKRLKDCRNNTLRTIRTLITERPVDHQVIKLLVDELHELDVAITALEEDRA